MLNVLNLKSKVRHLFSSSIQSQHTMDDKFYSFTTAWWQKNVYNQYIFLPYVFTTIIGIFSSHSKFDKVIRVFSLISVAITRSKFVRKSGRLLSTCSTDSSTQSPLTSGFNSDNNLLVKKRRKNGHSYMY